MNRMRKSGIQTRVDRALSAICIAIAVLCSISSRACADDLPAPLLQSIQTLLEAQGQEWITARDVFLQRPEPERVAALVYLARADATKEEKTLALILRTRIQRPADVAAYERGLAKDLTQPMIGRAGKPMYGHYAITNSENYGLSVEQIWKRADLVEELRTARYVALPHNVREVDSLLVLLERDPDRSATVASALSSVPDAGNDPRVPAAMLAAYQRARTENPRGSNAARLVMLYTASLGTLPARDTVLQMHAFERNLMIQQGKAPWNDQGEAEVELKAAFKEYKRGTQKQFTDEAHRAAAIDALKEQEFDALERCSEVLLWQAFSDAYKRLRDSGVPVNPPPDP